MLPRLNISARPPRGFSKWVGRSQVVEKPRKVGLMQVSGLPPLCRGLPSAYRARRSGERRITRGIFMVFIWRGSEFYRLRTGSGRAIQFHFLRRSYPFVRRSTGYDSYISSRFLRKRATTRKPISDALSLSQTQLAVDRE